MCMLHVFWIIVLFQKVGALPLPFMGRGRGVQVPSSRILGDTYPHVRTSAGCAREETSPVGIAVPRHAKAPTRRAHEGRESDAAVSYADRMRATCVCESGLPVRVRCPSCSSCAAILRRLRPASARRRASAFAAASSAVST
jgi:hypothetical protein